MAFTKYGDPQVVNGYYDGDEPVLCDKCGHLKTVVSMNEDENKVVCECELDDGQDD